MDLVSLFASSPIVNELGRSAVAARRAIVIGASGSSTSVLSASLARATNRLVLLMVAHVDDADTALDELRAAGVDAIHFPALEALPGESVASLDLLSQRLSVVERVAGWAADPASAAGCVLIAPIHALMQGVPSAARLDRSLLKLRTGDTRGPQAILKWLDAAGYKRSDAVQEPGDFAMRGGILDVFPPGDPNIIDNAPPGDSAAGANQNATPELPFAASGVPVRLDFFGDTIDRISEIDPDTMGADRTVGGVRLICASLDSTRAETGVDQAVNLLSLIPPTTLGVLSELMELTEQGRGYYERVTDPRGIFGPPAVFKLLTERSAGVIEVTSIGQYASGERTGVFHLPVQSPPPFDEDAGRAVAEVAAIAAGASHDGQTASQPMRVTVFCQNAAEQSRLRELLDQHASANAHAVESVVQYLAGGFVFSPTPDAPPRLALPYGEMLHRFTLRRRAGGAPRLRAGRAMDTFLDLQIGDYVVHTEHGIARFAGMRFMRIKADHRTIEEQLRDPKTKASRTGDKTNPADSQSDSTDGLDSAEFMTLEFDGSAKLHVPCMNADQVQKYVGAFKGKPKLSTLGSQRWQNQKDRVSESVRDLAAELLRVRAARESMPGVRFPQDTPWQREFEAEFPYTETEDQIAALAEIKKDMHSPRPMDRLLCGDVGYGKTELAIRAAFKAVEYGKQAAVLVPTTVLAEQHERTFGARFKDYPFKVASLSRFKTDAQIRETLDLLAKGQVDVVIGTHRLLSKDVRFADLGVVIIDEEQRFGVEHKERLLSLRMTVDVLTLSATPIPRTLHMSMLGLRDISSLTTAPTERRAVVTEVVPFNEVRLKQVIARELARDGQVFFVHNRVHNIKSMADDVHRLAPDARIVIGHGQMPDGELEEVMLKFMRRQADILVCTTIIESGIDIPTANTIIINDADRFGLAELHQLRGRVGRSKHRGYCYLLLPENRPLKEVAKKRLKAVEQFSMLGAGFKIAMRDLEIRGAGNILGPEQSGHIAAVGYDMYCQLMDRSVKELRNEVTAAPSETAVEIGVIGSIPKPYIPSDIRRLEAYRRIAMAATTDELAKVHADIQAAYGDIPEQTLRLLWLSELRIGSRLLGIRSITVREKDVIIRTTDQDAVAARMHDAPGRISVLPVRSPSEVPEIYFRPDNPQTLMPRTLLAVLCKRLGAPMTKAAGLVAAQISKTDAANPAPSSTMEQSRGFGQQPPRASDSKAGGFAVNPSPRSPSLSPSMSPRDSINRPEDSSNRRASATPNSPIDTDTYQQPAKPERAAATHANSGLIDTGGNAVQRTLPPSVPVKKPTFKPTPQNTLRDLQKKMRQFRTPPKPPQPPSKPK